MGILKKLQSKWVLLALIVVIISIFLASKIGGGVPAELATVLRGELRQEIEDTAEVLSQDQQTVYIEGAGKIIAVEVDVGDAVQPGYLLLSLDRTDLEFQLKEAEAGVTAAKAQLAGTELANYAHEIQLAEAALAQTQVAYDSAVRNYEKAGLLFEAQALSRGELEKAEDAYKAAKATLDTAKLQLGDAKQGAPEHIKNSYRSQLEQAVVHRDLIAKNIQKQELRAEIAGVILERLVEKDALVAPAQAAFVIGSTAKLELEAEILADDVHRIQVGNLVEITGKAVNDTVLQGKVVKIAPAAKTVTSNLGINQKRVPVTIALTTESQLLKPGYNLDVKIITAEKANSIKVPDSAVFDYQGKSRVFVVEQDRAKLREVQKGMVSANFIEIVQGLQEGERILVKPDNSIKEGVKIKPIPST